ncbi:MAG: type II toxin-antitoxin system Phd/YefM family antitoxin [Chloroflexi bacterium]|nr:type II toxin-antitoxin system Phd/YefM family antitoxin [Chloroflexota bacterium]
MNSIVPITQFNRGEANKIFDEVSKTGVKVVLKNNVPVGVLMAPERYDEMVEMLEVFVLFFEAERRMKNVKQSGMISEKQIMENLEISDSDLNNIDVEIE